MVDGKTYTLKKNVFIVGFGKAVSGMAKTLEDLIGLHIVRGVISIPFGSQALFKTHGKLYVINLLTNVGVVGWCEGAINFPNKF